MSLPLLLLSALAIWAAPLAAQAPADSLAASDSLGGLGGAPSVVIVDAPPVRLDSSSLPSPGGALRRALVLPGWGQVYVGQPAKAPFAAVAVVGLGGLTVYLHTRYRLYADASLYASCTEPTTPDFPRCDGFEALEDEWVETGSRAFATLRPLRDGFRRNRDLAALGTLAVYALQALDAYVAAQLAGFDVSEDLSVHVMPGAEGPAALVVVRL